VTASRIGPQSALPLDPTVFQPAAASRPSAQTACADEDRRARAMLTAIVEPGDAVIGGLVERWGARAVVAGIDDATLPVRRIADYRTRLGVAGESTDLAGAAGRGIRLMCPGDADWPSRLDDLGHRRPLGLWVRGGDTTAELQRALAVVGAARARATASTSLRSLPAWWRTAGGRSSPALPTASMPRLTAARSRSAGRPSPCSRVASTSPIPADTPRCSPHRRRGCHRVRAATGAHVTKSRFLERNRVIAAICAGTVVVEAAARSGALNTAMHAASLHRQVMAVPGPVTVATYPWAATSSSGSPRRLS
jgi:DNA processing protein